MLPLFGVVALWVPVMIAASYEWGHGEYYDYGWFVPPAALLLMVRRWKADGGEVKLPPRGLVIGISAILVPWFTVLRILGYTDPGWRLPMLLGGATAAMAGHALIGYSRGLKSSLSYIWITLLLFSALPWPSVVEQHIVRNLTQGVVEFCAEIFQLAGRPVEVAGDRLLLHDITVEVTDGCSGVRSFQSFVMATWFFSELQKLRAVRVAVLLGLACIVAFLINAGRTLALSEIRFSKGEAAFDAAHDWMGLLAFLLSGVIFYVISGKLAEGPRRRVVRTRQIVGEV